METIPTRDECIQILKDAGATQELMDHAEAVTKLALEIADLIMDTNIELVEAGALLHDIGRTKSHGIDHAVVGSQIAEELELPEALVKVIRNHIGAGITEEDAEEFGLPEGSYIPQSVEEKIECLEEMLAAVPKHKGTEKIQADLKTRLSKLRRQPKRKKFGRNVQLCSVSF